MKHSTLTERLLHGPGRQDGRAADALPQLSQGAAALRFLQQSQQLHSLSAMSQTATLVPRLVSPPVPAEAQSFHA